MGEFAVEEMCRDDFKSKHLREGINQMIIGAVNMKEFD